MPAPSPAAQDRRPRPLWNPYFAGVLLGLVLSASYLLSGRGLGATGAFSALATALSAALSSEVLATHPVHARYWNDGAPLASWTLALLGGVALGAWVSARAGRRIRVCIERGPRVGPGARLVLALAGGVIAGWGAKLAHGCTSGQALSGGALLNLGSLVFMAAVFASAYAGAWFLRREWL